MLFAAVFALFSIPSNTTPNFEIVSCASLAAFTSFLIPPATTPPITAPTAKYIPFNLSTLLKILLFAFSVLVLVFFRPS
jgi:hypothetical protein